MGYRKIYSRVSALRRAGLTLSLEMPIAGPSDSCNSCPSISLGPVSIPFGILEPAPSISPPSKSDLEAIGNSPWLPTTSDPVP